ncbi:hypothetical protein F5887DRAFT_1070316 [Amanita rubescens]|nr:hypothetical protein F5887DRAFT_1070316 [Amanita rubescens]
MYEQLLKFEALELSRKPSISWERIMQIRHLKDRMIRKCQRLCKTSHPKKLSKGEPPTFQTIMAPADFRVKEMEKWFREQQLRNLPRPAAKFGRFPPTDRSRSLPSSSKKPITVSQTWSDSHSKAISPPSIQELRTGPYQQPGPTHHQALVQSTKAPSVLSLSSHAISSPPALPILLRSQRSLLELEFNKNTDDELAPAQPDPSSPEPSLPNASLVAVNGSVVTPASSSQESLAVVEPDPNAVLTERQISHRRSCIKRPSIGEIPKTVSWADEAELEIQLSKYADAAKEAQLSGRKWEEIREIYLEQVTGLDALHDQVVQGIDNLRIESEHLERVENAIVQQREALRSTFQNLEEKQSLLQSSLCCKAKSKKLYERLIMSCP